MASVFVYLFISFTGNLDDRGSLKRVCVCVCVCAFLLLEILWGLYFSNLRWDHLSEQNQVIRTLAERYFYVMITSAANVLLTGFLECFLYVPLTLYMGMLLHNLIIPFC